MTFKPPDLFVAQADVVQKRFGPCSKATGGLDDEWDENGLNILDMGHPMPEVRDD